MIVNRKPNGVILINGKLQNYTLNSIEFCFDKQHILYKAKVGGEDIEFSDLELKVWDNEGCYKNNKGGISLNSLDENVAANISYYITGSNGEILQVTSNKLMMQFIPNKGLIPPIGYRQTREEVIFYDGYEFVDGVGTTHLRGGQGTEMKLKLDQIKLVNELKESIKKLDNAKGRILFDYSHGDGEMFFFNNENDLMKEICFDYIEDGINILNINEEHNFNTNIWEFSADDGIKFPAHAL